MCRIHVDLNCSDIISGTKGIGPQEPIVLSSLKPKKVRNKKFSS